MSFLPLRPGVSQAGTLCPGLLHYIELHMFLPALEMLTMVLPLVMVDFVAFFSGNSHLDTVPG